MKKNVIPDKKDIRQTSLLSRSNGIALVMALIITAVVLLLIISTMYVITSSTKMSAAGKRYATASEAADGAVEVMKDSINLVMYGEPISSLPLQDTAQLINAITTLGQPTTVSLNLSGTGLFQVYTAQITIERLYSKVIPGGRIEFARSAGGSGGTAIYFKISTAVTDSKTNTKAETTAVYRFVG